MGQFSKCFSDDGGDGNDVNQVDFIGFVNTGDDTYVGFSLAA